MVVVVAKPNKLRICLDPLYLNKVVKRNHYPDPTIDDIALRLTKALFSVVDAKDGFLQVELDEPSSYLTTMRTAFNADSLQMADDAVWISSSPEEFQRRLNECPEGLEQVDVITDDIVTFGQGDTT